MQATALIYKSRTLLVMSTQQEGSPTVQGDGRPGCWTLQASGAASSGHEDWVPFLHIHIYVLTSSSWGSDEGHHSCDCHAAAKNLDIYICLLVSRAGRTMPWTEAGSVSDQLRGLKLRVLCSDPRHLGGISRVLKEAKIWQAE